MTTSLPTRRARLLEYAPWILRDYFTNQGPSTALVVLLVGFLSVTSAITVAGMMAGAGGARVRVGDVPLELARSLLHSIIPALTILGTVFATNGIVANDRKMGYYRFLFAKPVSPSVYYATTFALYGVGLIAISLLLLLIWALTVRPTLPGEVFIIVPLMYVAYGGVGFLLSAAWRFDWLSLVAVLFVANVAWSLWEHASGLRHGILYLLPPVHRAGDIYALILRQQHGTPWMSIAWLAGYGLISFVLGLIVIRKRSLGMS
jgi:ABC-type transport system involved in multi-copper enzyme maturation permease subunit